ncbi:carbohydrate esterase family 5 protein [Melanomma pulvis-pyrius CBS 109.77]|uniref:cutinase n=1 Tax=Melanomma pulvis-pyrius CBS 109.77 TaxID=1314802 RepID=A0A6A6WPL0_9PLEO|nr:carbohydrate esterase family 5 protein [Melanomma pulvis-pyrius CBS 109.77]
MKSILYAAVAAGTLVAATPVSRDVIDTSFDMDDSAACASTAVIFARGTFDSGNIGVWVGPQFKKALEEKIDSVAFQGVNEEDYPATLAEYVRENGSESCADGLAATVDAYISKCPDSKIVVLGWSQGALCAHKGLNRISASALPQVKGLVTFGDPNGLMDKLAVPSSVKFSPFCVKDTVLPDPLCSQTLSSGFQLPTSISELHDLVLEPLRTLPDFATGVEQTKAAVALVPQLAVGFVENARYFAKDLLTGKVRKWLVTPQHFVYGNNGMAEEAAEFVAGL